MHHERTIYFCVIDMVNKVLMVDKNREPHLRTSYFYEVVCSACRIGLIRGNRLEATVQMINHAQERHDKDDWKNMLDACILEMYWNSPEAGHSKMTAKEILEFMGIMASDQDIEYKLYERFGKNFERNGA